MSRSVSNRKKKVTFREHPTHCEKTGRRGNNPHSNAIRSYFPFLIKQLKLSSPLYQSLNKKGVLTTDQIGLIELEDLAELKVAKLLEIVRNADGHVFKLFCSALGEMGYWYLAQILQTAAEEKDGSTSTVTHRNLKNNNLELSQKMEHMRKEYLRRIHELEEELASVSRERDITMRERNIIVLENHELQNLNHELQKLILKLESSTLSMIPNYPIHCVNVLPVGQMTGGQTSLLFTFNQHR
ncbi:uncharacterized protein LOC125451179 isoform X4 [Stegostoma tigrinum]|uniref:uncharacterized protein LOC125451179 isoform X4 n=1 Tax=Stegostoma tigrinum TaxID=3053191 RepID=UPI00202B8E1E|nr:uncharacterized protein LOC125451179 isoform X4 [Stegostoma tigrinum]